jgi:hypothetical protein
MGFLVQWLEQISTAAFAQPLRQNSHQASHFSKHDLVHPLICEELQVHMW